MRHTVMWFASGCSDEYGLMARVVHLKRPQQPTIPLQVIPGCLRLCRGAVGRQKSSLEQTDTAYQIAESRILADRIKVKVLTKIDHGA